MLTEEQIAEGWIAHDGGPCPVHGDVGVSVLFRDGMRLCVSTTHPFWKWHLKSPNNITAYRKELPDAR